MAIEKHMLLTHSLFEKAGEVFEGVAKLKERIAYLEAELDSFEKSFNEMTEAYMKSQRALWLARLRSLRHFSVLAYFQTIRAKGKESNMDFDEMAYRINLACVKCRMKAEEYK